MTQTLNRENKCSIHHGHVDVGGVQLHVDLHVDLGLGLLLKVLSDGDGARHLDVLLFEVG